MKKQRIDPITAAQEIDWRDNADAVVSLIGTIVESKWHTYVAQTGDDSPDTEEAFFNAAWESFMKLLNEL